MTPFIPKDVNDLPDSYIVTIQYVNGKKEEIDIVSHQISKDNGMIEVLSKDDLWSLVPLSSIQRIEFGRNFSKIVELKNKKAA